MATVALFFWPVSIFILFRVQRPDAATVLSILIGYLFLPENFSIDLPSLPPLTKNSVVAFACILAALMFAKFKSPLEQRGLENVTPVFGYLLMSVTALILFNTLLTVFSNHEPLSFGSRFIQGLRLWDVVSMVSDVLVFIIPYFLGRRYLASPEQHQFLLRMIVIFGLVYSLFMIIEIRLSPQFHVWVYGFRQHSFFQHVRDGDFRPMVFLQHGLWVGFFIVTAILAAVSLWRDNDNPNRMFFAGAAIWLLILLLLSKNLGASILALLFVPICFAGRRLQLLVIMGVTIAFLLYPVIRQNDLLPLDDFVQSVASYMPERAASFQFRLHHEDQLLTRAAEKPISGWGGWGRQRIYDEYGLDISVTDGIWVIILGVSGWLGYLGYFGILVLPLLFLRSANKRRNISPETMGLGLIIAANLIYLVPNSALSPVGWLIAGALAGFVQFQKVDTAEVSKEDADAAVASRAGYTRFARQAGTVGRRRQAL